MDFRKKIDKILEVKGLKLWKMAEDSRLGSTLEKAYQGNREMRAHNTYVLLMAMGVSKEWWDTGKGDLLEANPTPVSKKIDEGSGKIPFYDSIAVGGNGILADQTAVSAPYDMIEPGTFMKKATGSLRVYGHSMFPKYPAGCIVAFCDADIEVIIWGEDYVIELSDRRLIKRIEKSEKPDCIKAVSYNKSEEYQYSFIEIPVKKIKRLHTVLGMIILEASV